ncbi:MAG: TMEM43 family protein, partial [Gammaproteobacteria bacterium]
MQWSIIDLERIANAIAAWLPRIAGALLVLLGFYLLSKLVCRLLHKMMVRISADQHLTHLFVRSTHVVLTVVALITA